MYDTHDDDDDANDDEKEEEEEEEEEEKDEKEEEEEEEAEEEELEGLGKIFTKASSRGTIGRQDSDKNTKASIPAGPSVSPSLRSLTITSVSSKLPHSGLNWNVLTRRSFTHGLLIFCGYFAWIKICTLSLLLLLLLMLLLLLLLLA